MVERSTIRIIYFATAAFTVFVLYVFGLIFFVAKQDMFIGDLKLSETQRARINTARSLFREEPNVPEPKYFVLSGSQTIYANYFPHSIGLSEYVLDSLSEWSLAAIIAHEIAHAELFELVEYIPPEEIKALKKPHYFFDIRAAELTSKEAVLTMLQKTYLDGEKFYRENRFWFFLYGSFVQVNQSEILERIKQVRDADI